MHSLTTRILLAFLLAVAVRPASAHFPWMTTSDDGNVLYFFGETPADRNYHMPDSVSKAQASLLTANADPSKIPLTAVDQDDFVGLQSKQQVPSQAMLASKVTYGIYHGTRLNYCTQHCAGKLPTKRSAYRTLAKQLDLHAQLIDTDSGVDVFVLWKGKPLTDADVTLYCTEGHEEGKAKTDVTGKVSFNDKQVEDGLNGIVVGHTVDDDPGTIDEKSYKSVSYYLTATFLDPENPTPKKVATNKPVATKKLDATASVSNEEFPAIPQCVTSFGAAVTNDALYMYGGHMGEAHSYYAEAQATTLWKLDLENPKSWESCGDGPGLQGLAMVTHGGKLYRIGGFEAKNLDGEEKDLWSQNSVACYDPSSGAWQEMPSLPEPRSSFDAAVLGDKIYVVGGWSMQGEKESQWLTTAHVLDLSADQPQWEELPEPPFRRRALSAAAHNGKLYVVGGMQETGGPTKRVDVYDPATKTWSLGPEINGEKMDGFGSSSFATGGHLYTTTYSGYLQRLSDDGKSWQKLGELDRDRFFHRLLPLSPHRLLVIGGASMSSGKFEALDVIDLR